MKYAVMNRESGNLVRISVCEPFEHDNIGDAVLVYDEIQRQAAVADVYIDVRLVRITNDHEQFIDLTESLKGMAN